MTETIPLWIAVPAAIFLIISGLVTLIGSIGLLRLINFYSRVHAPTMGNTMGVFCLLMSYAILGSYLSSKMVVYPFIITVLLVICSPVTAILLMRAAIKRRFRHRSLRAGPSDPD